MTARPTPRTDALFDLAWPLMEARSNGQHDYCQMAELARELERENAELVATLEELVARCDGPEGVRADGSNIQTIRAHALLDKPEDEC